MNTIFAGFYEGWLGIFNQDYDLIFRTLYDGSGYFLLSLQFYLIPLLMLLPFYLLWKYPYGKLRHWIVWLFLILLVVGGSTYGIFMQQIWQSTNNALNEALYNPDTGYRDFTYRVVWQYVQVNVLIAVAFSIAWSLLLKQFSKVQKHLPL